MRENDWTNQICELFRQSDLGTEIFMYTFIKLPYAFEVKTFTDEWNIDRYDESLFETDLLIYEKKESKIIPRVIIESKVESVTTHDAITYSHKASYHKNVIPFVRYGIMCGNSLGKYQIQSSNKKNSLYKR